VPPFNLADYKTVQERINEFWEKYPEGAILTGISRETNEQKSIIFYAQVYKVRPDRSRDECVPDATGYAQEIAGTSNVNSDSHVENCETSAIGRALANLGFATKNDRPSREEMAKVARRQAEAVVAVANADFDKEIPKGEFTGRKLSELTMNEAKSFHKTTPKNSPWRLLTEKFIISKLGVEAANEILDLEVVR
jgi:hypothetical protein